MDNLKKNLPKLIFLVLGLVIAIELISVFKALREAPQPPLKSQAKPVGDAKLTLATGKKDYQVGEVATVQVRVDTGGHTTNGTDVILKYDPTVFEASSGAVKTITVKDGKNLKIYDDYPVADVDSKSGTIRISGISNVSSKGFQGVGVLATLSLKTKKAGPGKVSFEFKDGSTTDSNVIDIKNAQDLLGQVTNLSINITK